MSTFRTRYKVGIFYGLWCGDIDVATSLLNIVTFRILINISFHTHLPSIPHSFLAVKH